MFGVDVQSQIRLDISAERLDDIGLECVAQYPAVVDEERRQWLVQHRLAKTDAVLVGRHDILDTVGLCGQRVDTAHDKVQQGGLEVQKRRIARCNNVLLQIRQPNQLARDHLKALAVLLREESRGSHNDVDQ